jgi:serine/threonine-protein kinase
MEVATWTTVSRLLDYALDLPPEARAGWLDSLPAEYEHAKPTLRALLTGASSTNMASFLATLPKFEPTGQRDEAPQSEAAREGAHVGPYRLVRPIASGGQGSVWLAERADGLLARSVALKLPHGLAFRPGLAERIARERDILASLAHPNIARLYDAGISAAGEPYLALEYVEGVPIDAHATDRGLDVAARVRLWSSR